MRKTDRLFQIVQFLRTRRVTTALWLAQRLEVSERTIYRDIKTLMLSGVDIEGEAGIGYVVRKDFDLPPLMFTKEESQALSLGARLVQSWTDVALSTAAESALSKIESVLPRDAKGNLENTLLFSPFNRISPALSEMMTRVRSAADDRMKANITYRRADGDVSQRLIWPLGLFFWGSVWTLVSWCELREDYRIFRLDRIEKFIENECSYPKEEGKNLQDFMDQQIKAAKS